jgi:hypothetical protein
MYADTKIHTHTNIIIPSKQVNSGEPHGVSDTGTRSLHDDIKDILEVIPLEKIAAIARDYVQHDEQVRELARHIKTPEFQERVRKVVESEEAKAVSIIVCVCFAVSI